MDLKKLISSGQATFIDVREPWEYFEDQVEGAVNIPLGDLPYQLERLQGMTQPFIMYCRSGNRSGQAVTILRAHGFHESYNGGSVADVNQLLNHQAGKSLLRTH